jgi:hypothetical protein
VGPGDQREREGTGLGRSRAERTGPRGEEVEERKPEGEKESGPAWPMREGEG